MRNAVNRAGMGLRVMTLCAGSDRFVASARLALRLWVRRKSRVGGDAAQQVKRHGERLVVFGTLGKVLQHFDIGQDTGGMNRTAGRRKIAPGRQLERTLASPEGQDALHRASAEQA